MKRDWLILMTIASCLLTFVSCKKTETLSPVTLNNLYPLQTGKTYLYRLDSMVVLNLGSDTAIHSYLAKDIVDSQFLDASGRKSFRIYRYITDTAGIQPWQYAATFYATFDTVRTEFVDNNNNRFINLALPVDEYTTWSGNAYINTISPSPYAYLDGWQYQYQNLNQPFTVLEGTIPNTYTVFQQNDSTQIGIFNPLYYQERDYAIEVYAKGVGLIYKKFEHWVWQPSPGYYETDGYGITLNLISVSN